MLTEIHLDGMEFHAFHGLYPEEKRLGNRFIVDVKMYLRIPFNPDNEDLSLTVDYAGVYALLKEEMSIPCPLLESLGQRICGRISNAFPLVERMEVSIAKANPAIGGLCRQVRVSSNWEKS